MSDSYEYGLESTRHCWRELAIEHLPNLQEVILSATSHVDLWQLFKELLSEAGIGESRRAEVQSIYDYAWWCVAIWGNQDMATEVGTYFYEDLPCFSDFDEQMHLFITLSQFQQLEPFFRYRLNEGEYTDFRSRFLARSANSKG
jgi:hypothetical protein